MVLVHEVLHCMSLSHSFAAIKEHSFKAIKTDNIMDYKFEKNDAGNITQTNIHSRVSFWKYQWKAMESNGKQWKAMEDDITKFYNKK